MAHYLTMGHPTEKDYIQPFTVMAEEHPPSPEQGGPLLRSGDCGSGPQWQRVKPAMTVQGVIIVLKVKY